MRHPTRRHLAFCPSLDVLERCCPASSLMTGLAVLAAVPVLECGAASDVADHPAPRRHRALAEARSGAPEVLGPRFVRFFGGLEPGGAT